jgi:glycosyltransferase involved in cell wall biosynthesis
MNEQQCKRKICFVQINALGLLTPELRIPFGGAETRAVTFAKMLRGTGRFEVAFVVLNKLDQPISKNSEIFHKIHQIPLHNFTQVTMDIHLLDFYKIIHADCFVSLGANEISHEMVRYADHLGVPSVVGIASDQSLKESVFKGSMILNEYEIPSFHAWEAMHGSDLVLAQTYWQKENLFRKVGKHADLIPNPIPSGWENSRIRSRIAYTFDFLWVGRPGPDKNPAIVLEIAREMRSATFRIVMDGGSAAIPQPWQAHIPGNVTITDRVGSNGELRELMTSCRVIINTSPLEGFPNLMLQGAMVGCPFLFLNVDPDGWCSNYGCAASAHGDVDRFLALLSRTLMDGSWTEEMAGKAFLRATEGHSAIVIQSKLAKAMNQVIDGYQN